MPTLTKSKKESGQGDAGKVLNGQTNISVLLLGLKTVLTLSCHVAVLLFCQ